jgi:hypothetical protein
MLGYFLGLVDAWFLVARMGPWTTWLALKSYGFESRLVFQASGGVRKGVGFVNSHSLIPQGKEVVLSFFLPGLFSGKRYKQGGNNYEKTWVNDRFNSLDISLRGNPRRD